MPKYHKFLLMIITSTFLGLMLLLLAAPLHQPWKTTSLMAQMFHMFQVGARGTSAPKYIT